MKIDCTSYNKSDIIKCLRAHCSANIYKYFPTASSRKVRMMTPRKHIGFISFTYLIYHKDYRYYFLYEKQPLYKLCPTRRNQARRG